MVLLVGNNQRMKGLKCMVLATERDELYLPIEIQMVAFILQSEQRTEVGRQ